MEADLQRAINRLYDTFAIYPLRKEIAGCPCCIHTQDQIRLHSAPLHRLRRADLDKYMFKALNTWGDEDDWRHFLPRIFEIIAREWCDFPEIVIGKLAYAKWRQWPQIEQMAIETYFLELWKTFLASYPSQLPALLHVEDCLHAINQAVGDLTPYLTYWECTLSAPALRHLANYAISVCQYGMPKAHQQIRVWLFQPTTIELLERAFFSYTEEAFSAEFSEAHRLLLACSGYPQ